MTTSGRGEDGISVVRVRARYAADSMSVVTAQDHLYDLSCLMLVAYMLDPEQPDGDAEDTKRLPWKHGERLSVRAAHDTRVVSITYDGPLEIVLAMSSLAGRTELIAERLHHLYQDVHQASALTATSSTHVVGESIVRRHLEQALADIPSADGNRWVEGAARAAEALEVLAIESEN